MKIMVVTPYFYPKIGGMENYAYNISKGLKEKYGWEVVVVTSNHEERKFLEEETEGMKIYRLPIWFKISNTPINPLWYFQIKKIISKENPGVINAHTPVPFIADIASRVCGEIPFILTYQNDLAKDNYFLNLFCKIYYSILGNKTLRLSNKIITTSMYYTKNSPYLKNDLDKIEIVSPGVDASKFNLKVNKGLLKRRHNTSTPILFVGQLDKTHIHKGLYHLLKAVSLVKINIKDIKLIVIGKGNNIKKYKHYAEKFNLKNNVIFTGFLSDELLPQYYAGSDITILPSCNRSEGFGMVLIEAMACAKPVVGTKIGGIPYVIDDGQNGLLVPSKDPEALSKAIVKILKNPKLARKMGESGYKKVMNNFTWNIQIEKTYKVFLRK